MTLVYFICNTKNEVRYKNVQEQINKLKSISNDFEIHIIDAVMGKDLSDDEYNKLILKPSFMNRAEVGCALSHIKVYKDFLQSDNDYALVLEDDAIVNINNLDKNLINGIDVFIKSNQNALVLKLQSCAFDFQSIESLENGTMIGRVLNMHGTYGYILNKIAANEIFRIQQKVAFPFDWFKYYDWFGGVRLYSTKENFISTLPEEVSLIGNRSNSKYFKLYDFIIVWRIFCKSPLKFKARMIRLRLAKFFNTLFR